VTEEILTFGGVQPADGSIKRVSMRFIWKICHRIGDVLFARQERTHLRGLDKSKYYNASKPKYTYTILLHSLPTIKLCVFTPASTKKMEGVKKMTQIGQKYKCNICGNEAVITNPGAGALICCGRPMEVLGEGFEC